MSATERFVSVHAGKCPRCQSDVRDHTDTVEINADTIVKEWACFPCRMVWWEGEPNPCVHNWCANDSRHVHETCNRCGAQRMTPTDEHVEMP